MDCAGSGEFKQRPVQVGVNLFPEGLHADADVITEAGDVVVSAIAVVTTCDLNPFSSTHPSEPYLFVHVVGCSAEAEFVVLDHLIERYPVFVEGANAEQIASVFWCVGSDFDALRA